MPRVRPLAVAACLAVVATVWRPTSAAAQSRFALELDVGMQVPLSSSVHNAVSLDVEADGGDEAVGTPRLADRLNSVGFHLGASALIASLEVRYRFERFGWRGARVTCVGDRQAQQLPNGEIEDAEVRYDCGGRPTDISLPGESESGLVFHHLSAGRRFYLRRPPRAVVRDGVVVERERARIYGLPFGGLSLAVYRDPTLGRQIRAGINLGAGAGAEFPIDRRMSIVVDARYTMSMVGGSSSPSARAGRAIADRRNVASALMDTYHRVGLNLGFRLDFR